MQVYECGAGFVRESFGEHGFAAAGGTVEEDAGGGGEERRMRGVEMGHCEGVDDGFFELGDDGCEAADVFCFWRC